MERLVTRFRSLGLQTQHGGFRVISANSGTGNHVTAVVVTSASDKKYLLFRV